MDPSLTLPLGQINLLLLNNSKSSKVKSAAETNANAKQLLVGRTESLCFCCIMFYFAILQTVVKFVELF